MAHFPGHVEGRFSGSTATNLESSFMSVDLRAAVGFHGGNMPETLDRHRLNLILGQGDRTAALAGCGQLSQPGRWVRLGTRTGSSLGIEPTWRRAACFRSLCRHRNADAQSRRAVRLVADQFAGRRRFALCLSDCRPGRLCALLGERGSVGAVVADHQHRVCCSGSRRRIRRGRRRTSVVRLCRSILPRRDRRGRILCMPSSLPLPCSFSTRFTGTVPKRRRW